MRTVEKYGGTSMAQPHIVARRIERTDPNVVVVSAPGEDIRIEGVLQSELGGEKMTNMLRKGELEAAVERAHEVAARIDLEDSQRAGVLNNFSKWLHDYEFDEAGRSAAGEYFSALLLGEATGRQVIDPREVIFIANDRRPDIELSRKALRKVLRVNERYILPGFYGRYADGREGVQVLERGGSDTSGALAALALGATYYNLSNVDGMYTTDPRWNGNARRISQLTYKEMRALALGGAIVLHPEVTRIMAGRGLETIVASTFTDGPGTSIVDATHVRLNQFLGTASRDVYALSLEKSGTDNESGELRGAYDLLAEIGIPYLVSHDGPDQTTIVIGKTEEIQPNAIVNAMRNRMPGFGIDIRPYGMVVTALASPAYQHYADSMVEVIKAARDVPGPIIPTGDFSGVDVTLFTSTEQREEFEAAIHDRLVAKEPRYRSRGSNNFGSTDKD